MWLQCYDSTEAHPTCAVEILHYSFRYSRGRFTSSLPFKGDEEEERFLPPVSCDVTSFLSVLTSKWTRVRLSSKWVSFYTIIDMLNTGVSEYIITRNEWTSNPASWETLKSGVLAILINFCTAVSAVAKQAS